MNDMKFIGTTSLEDVDRTMSNSPWKPKTLAAPYLPITLPGNHFLTVGSGCYSGATLSALKIEYISAIDLLREDGCGTIDVDHYLASRLSGNIFEIYKEPPQVIPYHHLTNDSPFIDSLDQSWQELIRDILNR